jgi:hypothetical protein
MSASPINPITVLGSGYGFGTETGQNHYMNIVGYNGGYVYTSNPMYGSGRYPVGTIANNSILGLFGRGTSDDIKAGINSAVDELDQRISDIDPDSPTGKLVDLIHSVLDVRDARSYVGNPDKNKRKSVREKLDSAVDTGEEKYHSAKAKFTGIKMLSVVISEQRYKPYLMILRKCLMLLSIILDAVHKLLLRVRIIVNPLYPKWILVVIVIKTSR